MEKISLLTQKILMFLTAISLSATSWLGLKFDSQILDEPKLKPVLSEVKSEVPEFPLTNIFSVSPEKNPPTRPPVYYGQMSGTGKPKPRDLGPVQTVKILSLSEICNYPEKNHLQISLSRAILISEIFDMRTLQYDELLRSYPEIGTDAFLILEGEAFNSDVNQNETIYSIALMKLKRGGYYYQPGSGYSTVLSPYSTGYFAGYFPILMDETKFSIQFCFATNPQTILLDFNSQEVMTMRGVYNMDSGFWRID